MASTSALEQTQSLREEFKRVTSSAGALARQLTPSQWTQRPAQGRWSVAECIEHLTLTTGLLLPRLEAALRQAPAGNGGPLRTGWVERLLAWYLEPPYRRGSPTKAPFAPRVAHAPEQVLPRFAEIQARLDLYIQSAAGLALDRTRIESPFDARLKYSCWAALLILVAHQRRHLWQAAQVLSRVRTPGRP
jgi:hypothetical protein